MANNTPFPIPNLSEEEGYVHDHPKTGRKYQLNNFTQPNGNEVHVWSTVSDVTNRTWVSAEDPLQHLQDHGSLNEPNAGDTWWDTHHLELRVLHHPIIGEDNQGKLLYGKKQWISSTHPMANMLGEGGNDKNQMIGQVLVRLSDPFILEDEKVTATMSIPYYTGPDNFYEDPADDPVPYPDKRFTVEWKVSPQYNVDNPDDYDAATLLEFTNTVEPYDESPQKARVNAGKFPGNMGDPNYPNAPVVQALTVSCVVTAKEQYNDKFIITGVDSNGKPILHSSSGFSVPLTVESREERTVVIPVTIAKQTREQFVDHEADLNVSLLPDADKADEVTYLYMANGEYQVDDVLEPDANGDIPQHTIIEKLNNYGDQAWMPGEIGDPDLNKQIPHIAMGWDPSKFALSTLVFDFGPTATTASSEQRLLEVDPNADPTLFDLSGAYNPSAWLGQYTLRFFTDGYIPSGNVVTIPDESTLYTNEITRDYEVVSDYDIGGAAHSVIKVSLYYSTDEIPAGGLFFAMYDEASNLIFGTHGHIYRNENKPKIVEEDN
jgi:hypothetical protein